MPSTVHISLFLYRQELNTFLLKVSNSLLDKSNCISTNYVISLPSLHVGVRAPCGWTQTSGAQKAAVSAGSVPAGWWISHPGAGQHKSVGYRLWTPWSVLTWPFSLTLFPSPAQLFITCSSVNSGKLGGAWERGYFFALVSRQKLNTSL